MIDILRLVERFSNYNGMSLVDFCDVAMPIYRVTATMLVHESKKLSTIEEFTLRSVALGFSHLNQIQGILGLSERVVKGALSSLIRSELIAETAGGVLVLTSLGVQESQNYARSRPFERQVTFDYDGITRKVILGRNSNYLAPKEVKTHGLLEVRPIPARRPEDDEIDLSDVSSHLSQFSRFDDSNLNLLRIRRITRGTRLFYNATMLIYKDDGTGTYEAAFCIDGNMSEAHGLAFLKAKGLEKLSITQTIEENNDKKKIQKAYPNFVIENTRRIQKSRSNRKQIFDRLKNEIARKKGGDKRKNTTTLETAVKSKPISLTRHIELLIESMQDSEEHLLIVSSRITSSAVNTEFVNILEARLKKGVDVFIGYGPDQSLNESADNIEMLQILSRKYGNLKLECFDNVTANILIKDKEWYAISSFNWLSFRGDPIHTFTDTWGIVVSDNNLVGELFRKMSLQFKENNN